MKNVLAVFCAVSALSILMFELIPSSGFWRTIIAIQQQKALSFTNNAVLIKHNKAGGISTLYAKQEEEHLVAPTNGVTNSGGSTNGILFSYQKQEDEHILSSLTSIRTVDADNALFRMGIDESRSVGNKEKLTHQAFRIHEKTFKLLQKEAANRGISVSNYVNNILKNHVSYGMYFERFAFIPVSKEFMRTIFIKIERDQDIEQYSRDLGTVVVNEYASNYFPNLNNETLIQFLEMWFRRFQHYQHRVYIVEDNGIGALRHTFSVHHDINANFSIVLKRILSGLIEPITKSIVLFSEVTPSTMTFSFET
jgi:hypothetical protein